MYVNKFEKLNLLALSVILNIIFLTPQIIIMQPNLFITH